MWGEERNKSPLNIYFILIVRLSYVYITVSFGSLISKEVSSRSGGSYMSYSPVRLSARILMAGNQLMTLTQL